MHGRPAVRITSVHVRDQNPLGPTALRLDGRARLSLGGHRVDGLASCVPAGARACLVRNRTLAGLPAGRPFYLVVQIRRLRACHLHPGWLHRRERRNRSHRRRHLALDLARERSPACHDVRLGTMGGCSGGSTCRAFGTRRRCARLLWSTLSAAQWSRTRAVFCSNPLWQGRRSGHSDTADLAESFTRKPTRRSPALPTSCPIRHARSRRR